MYVFSSESLFDGCICCNLGQFFIWILFTLRNYEYFNYVMNIHAFLSFMFQYVLNLVLLDDQSLLISFQCSSLAYGINSFETIYVLCIISREFGLRVMLM